MSKQTEFSPEPLPTKRSAGRPSKYPWRTAAVGACFSVGVRPGRTTKDAKVALQRLASYYRRTCGMDFKVASSGRSVIVTRVA